MNAEIYNRSKSRMHKHAKTHGLGVTAEEDEIGDDTTINESTK